MRKRSMIDIVATAAALLLLAALFLSSALAQDRIAPAKCEGCLGPEQCAHQLATCRSECRARIFTVDPRREVCLKGCSEVEPRCTQTADPPAQLGPKLRSRPRPTGVHGQAQTPDPQKVAARFALRAAQVD
jgi:hypothetical protein